MLLESELDKIPYKYYSMNKEIISFYQSDGNSYCYFKTMFIVKLSILFIFLFLTDA